MREPFLINPPRYARTRHRSGAKVVRRKSGRKSNPVGETLITVGGNPMRYFHRRRNPVVSSLKGAMDVRGWAPLAVTGGLSAVAAGIAPGYVARLAGVSNPWLMLGLRVGVAFGGGMLVSKYVSSEHGKVWTVVGTSLVAYDLLKQFVLPAILPAGLAGVGFEYDGYTEESDSQVNAFPNQISAYPDDGGMQAFPLGSYPYDGAYGSYATAT